MKCISGPGLCAGGPPALAAPAWATPGPGVRWPSWLRGVRGARVQLTRSVVARLRFFGPRAPPRPGPAQ
eukprot:11210094-Lingulodinium_polyedra.AAC.1